MSSIFGLFSAPTALNIVGQAAKAAATPFEALLQAATQANESPAASNESKEEAEDAATLQERVARQLQELLESLGIAAGDQATLRIDSSSGEITVNDHPLAGEIEAAIQSDSPLTADIRRLAESHDLFETAPFFSDSRLRVEVAEEQGAALLEWR